MLMPSTCTARLTRAYTSTLYTSWCPTNTTALYCSGTESVVVYFWTATNRRLRDASWSIITPPFILWFSQTQMRMINWELPLINRSRFGPVLRAVIAFAMASFRSRAALQLEILALRHQIGVLQRSVKRPKLTPADRVLWAWLCSVWNGWQSGVFIMKAVTVVGWHRKGFGLFWSWKIRRGTVGRPAVPKEVRELIRMLSRENPLWGAPHIHGELLKLGIHIGETSVSKYMVRRRKQPSQTWRTFLDNNLNTCLLYTSDAADE